MTTTVSTKLGSLGNEVIAQTDPVTGGITLSGGGKSDLMASMGIRSPITGALKLVTFGHSYLDEESYTASLNRPTELMQGTVNWINIFLGRPFEVIKSHAIGGERLIDLDDRIDAAIAEGADIYVWNIGINDLKGSKNSGSSRFTGNPYVVDTHQTDLKYCISRADYYLKKLRTTGALIIVFPETWPANGSSIQTKHLAARTLQYNEYLRFLCSIDTRMEYVPLDTFTADVTNSNGDVLSGYYYDYIHPSPVGGFNRGKAAAKQLKNRFKKIDRLSNNVVDTYSNLKIAGTSLSSNGDGTLRIMLPNVSGVETLIRTGDTVGVAVPSAGHTEFNGRFSVVAYTSTYIDVDCAVAGTYTGTINVSTARQMFSNPLMLTQTGGSVSGVTLSSGTVPADVSIYGPAGCSVAFDNSQSHTDIDGAVDGLGKWCDVTITGTANATINVFMLANRGPANTGSSVYGRIFSGDKVQALYDFEAVSMSGVYTLMAGMTGSITIDSVATTLEVWGMYRDAGITTPHPNQPFRGVVGMAEYKIPDGTLETFDGQVKVIFGASGGSCRLRIGRVSIKVLSDTMRDTDQAFTI